MMMEPNKKKKKLTFNSIGLLLLVVMAGLYFYTWQAGTNFQIQAVEINDNLEIARLQIKMLDEPAGEQEERLAAAQAELAAAQTGFPDTVDRNEVIAYILNVAEDYRIQILPLVSDGWVTVNTGIEYRVLQITATAEGSFENVNSFMAGLQAGRYPTLVIPEFSISRSDSTNPGFPGEEMPVVVDMKIYIYTAPGMTGGNL